MIYLSGSPTFFDEIEGEIEWYSWESEERDGDRGVCLRFHLSNFYEQIQRREAVKILERIVRDSSLEWIYPGPAEWKIDLDSFRNAFEVLSNCTWLKGRLQISPEFEPKTIKIFEKDRFEADIAFYLDPKEITRMSSNRTIPIEITESLGKFKEDYPDPSKACFIMMQFGQTKFHEEIFGTIHDVLNKSGFTALRADNKQYHDDLFSNVLTYIWGCGFGIAVFERLEDDEFNPNVSLEVGYLLALEKPICFLKDKTLKALTSDLVGKLYKQFDPQKPR